MKKIILLSFLCTVLFLRLFVLFGIKTGLLFFLRNNIGNYYPHHIIYGVIILAVVGYLSLTLTVNDKTRKILSVAFGIGLAFVVDELLVTMYVTGKYSPEFAKMYYSFPTYIPVLIVTLALMLLFLKKR